MKECKNIEPLVYLYREGELAAEEQAMVLEHIKRCTACAEILRQLQSMDAAVASVRESDPRCSAEEIIVTESIRRIVEVNSQRINRERILRQVDELFGWLRPVLSFVVVAAAILYMIQSYRDGMKIATLENRLNSNGHMALSEYHPNTIDAMNLIDAASLNQRGGRSLSPLKGASMGINPFELIGENLCHLLRSQRGLFDYLSQRYPNLSTVKLDDGISAEERKILATEGRELMMEVESLIREGEK